MFQVSDSTIEEISNWLGLPREEILEILNELEGVEIDQSEKN